MSQPASLTIPRPSLGTIYDLIRENFDYRIETTTRRRDELKLEIRRDDGEFDETVRGQVLSATKRELDDCNVILEGSKLPAGENCRGFIVEADGERELWVLLNSVTAIDQVEVAAAIKREFGLDTLVMSTGCPLGEAVYGRRAGQEFRFEKFVYRVVEVVD